MKKDKIIDPKAPIGLIYKIQNLINGKVYIGQTVNSFYNRPFSHFRYGYCANRYLYDSIRKYGVENFGISLLTEVYSYDDLDWAETFYIVEWYDSINPARGYNLDTGGNQKLMYLAIRHRTKEQKEYFAKKTSEAYKKARIDHPEMIEHLREAVKAQWENWRKNDPETMLERNRKVGEASAIRWKNPDFKKRTSEAIKLVRSTPESRAKTSQKSIEACKNNIELRRAVMKEFVRLHKRRYVTNGLVIKTVHQENLEQFFKENPNFVLGRRLYENRSTAII